MLRMNLIMPRILSIDVLREILLRVDPSCIFDYIMVCKEWFRIIIEPAFGQDYLRIWAGHPKLLVGFLMYPYIYESPCWDIKNNRDFPVVRLLTTSKLGCMVKEKESMKQPDYFICFVDGLLLSGTLPSNFYVFKPFTSGSNGLLAKLPPPPVEYENVVVAIITQSPNLFKVVFAKIGRDLETTLDIQTFSSSTGMWDQSQIPCLSNIGVQLTGEPGFVSSMGVVYWQIVSSGLAAYDIKNEHINRIPEPPFRLGRSCSYTSDQVFAYYGVSPQGSVWCAKQIQFDDVHSWYLGMIKLSVFDEDEKVWSLKYNVELKSVWMKHETVLRPCFGGDRPWSGFRFVSFVPGTTDRIYVELDGVLFVYHLCTQELDSVGAAAGNNYTEDVIKYDGDRHRITRILPLTLAELGIWPGSSPVLNLL